MYLMKITLKGLNFNNRGCKPTDKKGEILSTLQGLNNFK